MDIIFNCKLILTGIPLKDPPPPYQENDTPGPEGEAGNLRQEITVLYTRTLKLWQLLMN